MFVYFSPTRLDRPDVFISGLVRVKLKENLKVAEPAVPHALKHRRRARKRWQAGSKRLSMVGSLVNSTGSLQAPLRQAQGAYSKPIFYVSTKQLLHLGSNNL